MELVDDEDVETMVNLYCGNGSEKNAPIHLFVELVGMEQNEDVNASDEEDGAEEPRMVAPISYVDSESTMGGMGIDLNITPDVDMVGGEEEGAGEEEGGGDYWDEEVDSDADPDVDDMRRIVIHNNPRPHMSLLDPDAAYVAEFPEYPEIVHSHGLAVTSDDNELFITQRFNGKEECVYAIKRYSMKISVDYKVSVSTLTIYVGECWKAAKGCNLRDIPTIKVLILIAKMQARFQYRVSYQKAWIAKQMAMEQLYGDYNSSYNELQGWIAAMREYVPGTVIELQTMYELEPHIFRQRMIRLESDMEGQTNTSFRQWLRTTEPWQWAQSFDECFRYGHMTTNLVEGINAVLLKTHHLPIASVFSATFYRLAILMPRMGQKQVDQIQAGHVFVEHVRDAMVINRRLARSMNVEIYSQRLEMFRVTENIGRRPRSYGVDLRNRRCECRKFETLHYPCAHVVAACAKVNLDAEQYVDDVYTLERTLRVWENEFPVLPDLSTWEVPPITFELVPDRGLRRNPRGRPQSSRIRNEMDIRKTSERKRCGICRLSGHSRNKCPNRNFHVGQSSGSGRN
ncbi:hypothetical protein GOBAR_DD07901 [Gossypium barbadense]|nr:hypothetical protein GOBAR_DD07901 [Gossypium barbadense]